MPDMEITAKWDEASLGRDRDHFTFMTGTGSFIKDMDRLVCGGLYVRKGYDIPDRIIITLDRR